jgi:BirA family biotin operon repressor/biotin-[acetyl-CoA-carboxylase] ligase
MTGDLTPERIQAQLHTQRYGRSLELLAETGSSNDDARRAALAGVPDGHLLVSESQSQGRGSRGRSWSSPPGQDLYLSLVARVPLVISELPPLTLAVGLAVAETAEAFLPAGTRAQVKWPNDVWLERRKLAGILVESASTQEALQPVVIGIGLNVNRRSFPSDLDTPGVSLALARGGESEPLERAPLLASLLGRLEHWVDRFVQEGPGPVARALEPRLALLNEPARCDETTGIVTGITAEGALLLRTEQGTRSLFAGTLRPL